MSRSTASVQRAGELSAEAQQRMVRLLTGQQESPAQASQSVEEAAEQPGRQEAVAPTPGFADLVQSLLADWRGGGVAVNVSSHEGGVLVVADGHNVAITPPGGSEAPPASAGYGPGVAFVRGIAVSPGTYYTRSGEYEDNIGWFNT